MLEVTSAGEIAWEFGEADDPTLGLNFVTSIQVLKDGNLLVGNWVGGGGGDGVLRGNAREEGRLERYGPGPGGIGQKSTVGHPRP